MGTIDLAILGEPYIMKIYESYDVNVEKERTSIDAIDSELKNSMAKIISEEIEKEIYQKVSSDENKETMTCNKLKEMIKEYRSPEHNQDKAISAMAQEIYDLRTTITKQKEEICILNNEVRNLELQLKAAQSELDEPYKYQELILTKFDIETKQYMYYVYENQDVLYWDSNFKKASIFYSKKHIEEHLRLLRNLFGEDDNRSVLTLQEAYILNNKIRVDLFPEMRAPSAEIFKLKDMS